VSPTVPGNQARPQRAGGQATAFSTHGASLLTEVPVPVATEKPKNNKKQETQGIRFAVAIKHHAYLCSLQVA